MKKCKIKDCENKHSAKGFCNLHYQRFINSVPMDGNLVKTVRQRIEEKSTHDDNGCLVWNGAKSGGTTSGNHKYGYINIGGKICRVHRIYYALMTGDNIEGKHLCHHCDNPSCINPDHMFLGTVQDNMNDMISKGRARHPKGVDNHSKLTEEQVLAIRSRWGEGEGPLSISKDYPVSVSTINSIVHRIKWTHI